MAQGALLLLAVAIFAVSYWGGDTGLVLWGLVLVGIGILVGFVPFAEFGGNDSQVSIRKPIIAWIGSGFFVIAVAAGGGVIAMAPTGYEAITHAMISVYVFAGGSILTGICGLVSLSRNERPRLFSFSLLGIAASGIAWVVLQH